MELFNFSLERVEKYIKQRNEKATIYPICAKDGRGIAELADKIRQEITTWRN